MPDASVHDAAPTALILLPTYNERENLPTIAGLLLAAAAAGVSLARTGRVISA